MIEQLMVDSRVVSLLKQILQCGVSDAKIPFSQQVPPELINNKRTNSVPGSPWHWVTIQGRAVLMDDDAHGNINEVGYTKSTFAAKLKEVKARVRSLADKEKDKAEKERQAEAERVAQEKKLAEEKKQKEKETREKALREFKKESGLNAFEANDVPADWCSKANRQAHLKADGTFRHREEYLEDYPDITEEQYVEMAVKLGNQAVDGKKILGYTCKDKNGFPSICRYNYVTNDYVKINKDGLVTMFRPPDGKEYYYRHRTKETKNGKGLTFVGERED